jgi:hypothetical protein
MLIAADVENNFFSLILTNTVRLPTQQKKNKKKNMYIFLHLVGLTSVERPFKCAIGAKLRLLPDNI